MPHNKANNFSLIYSFNKQPKLFLKNTVNSKAFRKFSNTSNSKLLVDEIIRKHRYSVKSIAQKTGISISTLYNLLSKKTKNLDANNFEKLFALYCELTSHN